MSFGNGGHSLGDGTGALASASSSFWNSKNRISCGSAVLGEGEILGGESGDGFAVLVFHGDGFDHQLRGGLERRVAAPGCLFCPPAREHQRREKKENASC